MQRQFPRYVVIKEADNFVIFTFLRPFQLGSIKPSPRSVSTSTNNMKAAMMFLVLFFTVTLFSESECFTAGIGNVGKRQFNKVSY